ncbi:unnamed protein product [Mesocestoides corti]|uniref:NIF3-like protein 1 n=1 Tax=Mesocestoides corti TaxID=53468 RepID=A0A0R3UB75_MESCO|nr:unnamed protein product [Mesocestoides corti]
MECAKLAKILDRLLKIPLAEPWDNVGLLIQPSTSSPISRICLTNDLTEPVLDEVISLGANFVISYHPPIFRPLKRLVQNSWKERVVVKCLENKIAVYSPHTALDSVSGGINDWLLSPFDLQIKVPIKRRQFEEKPATVATLFGRELQAYCIKNQIPPLNVDIPSSYDRLAEVVAGDGAESFSSALSADAINLLPEEGSGRVALLNDGYTIQDAIEAYKRLFDTSTLKVALGYGKQLDSPVTSVAVCAGSGGSMFAQEPMAYVADLLVTGEASHHEQLDIVARGATIITAGHSVSERGYLSQRLRPWLASELKKESMEPIPIDVASTDAEPGVIL